MSLYRRSRGWLGAVGVASAVVTGLWVSDVAAQPPIPVAPGGPTGVTQVTFVWTPISGPVTPTTFEVYVEPTGNALSDGTVAPELPAPVSETIVCSTAQCQLKIAGEYFDLDPGPSGLFTADGDEYCWKVREIRQDGQPLPWSAEMCFRSERSTPPPTPPVFSPVGPGSAAAEVSKHAPVVFDWDRTRDAFGYELRVATGVSASGDLEGDFVCSGLDNALPLSSCDPAQLEVGRTYYWQVQGFKDGGACFGGPVPGRCYGDPQTSPVPSFVLISCPADCDDDGQVSVSELVRSVRASLGQDPVAACPNADVDGNGTVSVAELIRGVNAALNGCAG